MKPISADARLAIPVAASLALAIAVLLLGAEDPVRTAQYAWTAAAVCCGVLLLSVWCAHRTPPVEARRARSVYSVTTLAAALSGVLAVLIAVRARHHDVRAPWQVSEQASDVPWFLYWAAPLRELFLEHTASLPGVGAQLVPGLAIGDTSRVSAALTTAMKTVSLTHITAVSGANCAIVTLSIIMITARLGWGRRWRLTVAAIALIAFVVLVTPQPSVVRAAVMSLVVIIATFSGRPGSGLPLLAVAAYLMLVWDPWWAVDYGYLLSVLATVGLLVFSGPLTARLSTWMPSLVAAMIAIPLSAQLVCQPAIVLLSPQLPTYGVLANVLAGPAAPLATIAGLLVVVMVWWWPGIADVLLWVCWLPAEWIGQCALVISAFPIPFLPWLSGAPGTVLAAALSVAVLMMFLASHAFIRRITAAIMLNVCVAYLVLGGMSALGLTSDVPEDWTVASCDVGQGDAFFVRSAGKYALIDTGKSPTLLNTCMSRLHITAIDLLVLTHYDADHVGAVASVYGKVSRALVGPVEDSRGEKIVTELSRSGVKIERATRGMHDQLGDASWSVLWPTPEYPTMQSGNPGSIVMRWQLPGLTALFLADLDEDAQRALLSDGVITPVDVVKVAHHGSADQSAQLYAALHARLALISVGRDNGYGHPTDKILSILHNLGVVATRTDEQGLVLVSEHGSTLSLWSERAR